MLISAEWRTELTGGRSRVKDKASGGKAEWRTGRVEDGKSGGRAEWRTGRVEDGQSGGVVGLGRVG